MELPKIHHLTNGLKVIFIPFKGIDSASILFAGKAGCLWEGENQHGVAHFLEHVVHEGSEKYPSHDKLREIISDIGGITDAFTSYNNVVYVTKTLKEDLERGMDYLSQVALHPLLEEKEINKHREIITQEITQRRDNPLGRFGEDSRVTMFSEKERLRYPIGGTVDSVKSMTRNNLVDFLNTNYIAENFILGVCGNLHSQEVFASSENYFSEMKKGKENNFEEPEIPQGQQIFSMNDPQVNQATISILFEAPMQYSKESYPASNLIRILGIGPLSRLYREVRQKRGLAYATGANYFSSNKYGFVELMAQIDEKNLQEVFTIFKDEMKRISQEEVNDHEFNRNKKEIVSAFVFADEDPESRADFYTSLVLDGYENENYQTILEKYQAVTKGEILLAAKKIFSTQPKIRILSKNIKEEEISRLWNDNLLS